MYKKTEAKIENTIFEARTDKDENILSYRISPKEGYKLHEITLDETNEETCEVKLGFTTSYITAGVNYDFKKNERQIYALEVS